MGGQLSDYVMRRRIARESQQQLEKERVPQKVCQLYIGPDGGAWGWMQEDGRGKGTDP